MNKAYSHNQEAVEQGSHPGPSNKQTWVLLYHSLRLALTPFMLFLPVPSFLRAQVWGPAVNRPSPWKASCCRGPEGSNICSPCCVLPGRRGTLGSGQAWTGLREPYPLGTVFQSSAACSWLWVRFPCSTPPSPGFPLPLGLPRPQHDWASTRRLQRPASTREEISCWGGRYLGAELFLPGQGLLHVLAQGAQLLLLNRVSLLQNKESLFLFHRSCLFPTGLTGLCFGAFSCFKRHKQFFLLSGGNSEAVPE